MTQVILNAECVFANPGLAWPVPDRQTAKVDLAGKMGLRTVVVKIYSQGIKWYYPAPKAPGDGVWGIMNPVVRGVSPRRGLDLGDPKVDFLVEDSRETALAKTFL